MPNIPIESDPYGHHRPIARARVRYQGRLAEVVRRLPGRRLDLLVHDGQVTPVQVKNVHPGPGGWSPIPGEPLPDQAPNRAR